MRWFFIHALGLKGWDTFPAYTQAILEVALVLVLFGIIYGIYRVMR